MDFVLFLEAHQPFVLRREQPRRLESWLDLVDIESTRRLFEKAAGECYTPLFRLLEELKPHGVRVGLRVSGVLLAQAERWGRGLVEQLRHLVSTGAVELVAGPYYNSIPHLLPSEEFVKQVEQHAASIRETFGVEAKALAAPYLTYSDEVGRLARDELGLRVALAEGEPRSLAWRTSHFVYKHPLKDLSILVRDQELSNEVAFGLGKWLTAAHFASRVSRVEGTSVLVALPAETFGTFVPAGAGAFDFLRWLPKELGRYAWVRFALPSEAAEREPVDVLSAPQPVTWLETKDLRPLTESTLQQMLLALLLELRGPAERAGLLEAWRILTQADYLLASRSPQTAIKLAKALCALQASLG